MDIEGNQNLLDQLLAQSYKEKPDLDQVYRAEITNYKNLSGRFHFTEKNFNIQYAHLYFTRLNQLRPFLEKKLKSLHLGHCKVIEIRNGDNTVTIGTLYKEMKLKPSILKKMNQDQNLGVDKFKNYTSEDDALYLEDETGRVKLNFSEYQGDNSDASGKSGLAILERQYTPLELVTGLVVAVKGRTDKLGVLFVHKILFCDVPQNPSEIIFKQVRDGICKFVINPQKNFTNIHDINYYMSEENKNKDKFLAIVSGLNYRYDKSKTELTSLKQFLFGDIPNKNIRKVYSFY